jgi:hypothetical protein
MSELKNNLIAIRLSDGDIAKLNYIAKVAKIKKSHLIRKWIDETVVDHKNEEFYTNISSVDKK